MAHRIARICDGTLGERAHASEDWKALVVCGASHALYNFGVPERVFALKPWLRESTYRLCARQVGGEATAAAPPPPEALGLADLSMLQLRDLYGDPTKDAADAVFVYEYMRNAANAEQVPS